MCMDRSTLFRRPRWQLTLAIVFFAQLLTAVGFSIVFPFLPLYVEDLGSVTGMSVELGAGLVIAVQGFTMALAAPIWGVVADRYGRKLMSMRAQFGGAILLLLMAYVSSAEELIFLRGIQGLITGTVAANNAMVAAAVPRERIGFAMGTLQVGLWGGVAAGPLVGGLLADAYGFAMPFFITAGMLVLGGVMIHFGVQEEFVPLSKEDRKRISFFGQWRHVISASGVSMVLLMRFLAGVARQMVIPIAPLFVVSLLPANAEAQSIYAGLVISVSSATATFSGVYLGRLGDRIGHRTVLIACAVASVFVYAPQVIVGDVWQLLALQALAGLAAGGLIAAPSALLARYTDPGEEGAVYGLDNSIVAAARAVAPLVGAWIAALMGLRATFAAMTILFIVVAAAAYFALPDDQRAMRKSKAIAYSGD